MKEAHEELIKIIKLIEEHYGEGKITPNLHLSLHLCECSYDYGPYIRFGVLVSNVWMAYVLGKANLNLFLCRFFNDIYLTIIIHKSFIRIFAK